MTWLPDWKVCCRDTMSAATVHAICDAMSAVYRPGSGAISEAMEYALEATRIERSDRRAVRAMIADLILQQWREEARYGWEVETW